MPDARILFLHGGPGMNSAAEAELLGPLFARDGLSVTFWQEPASTGGAWPFRADAGYSNALASAEDALAPLAAGGPVEVMGHSFGALYALELARKSPGTVARATLVAPQLDLLFGFRKVLGLAVKDFRASDPAKAQQLETLLAQNRAFFDAPMQQAFLLAKDDPALLVNYWRDAEAMGAFFGVWQRRGLDLDAQAFFAVLSELAGRSSFVSGPVGVPVRALFGAEDPVVDRAVQVRLLEGLCPDFRWTELAGRGHYLHFERPAEFLSAWRALR